MISGRTDDCGGTPRALTDMPTQSTNTHTETRRQNFERVLSREPFKGLKAILDSLPSNPEALLEAVAQANSYEDLLRRLDHRMILTNQIHV